MIFVPGRYRTSLLPHQPMAAAVLRGNNLGNYRTVVSS
jgi:hypothetical protein